MKKKLLLFLSQYDHPGKIAIASTLAWLSKSKGYFFDNYYDSYHKGIHYGGGDPRNLEEGVLNGGTVSGGRHFEELYFLLHNFDVVVVSIGETLFSSCLRNFKIPVISSTKRLNILYKEIFDFFSIPLPSNIVMIGSAYKKALSGLEAYIYPEIYYRESLGVPDSIPDEELADLFGRETKISCFFVNKETIVRLRKRNADVEVLDNLDKDDDYASVSRRISERWKEKAKGWLLGDPKLVSHWLPEACEEGLMAIYSVPQEKIITQLGDLISSKGRVVYGRQYSDKDFFELSKLNQSFQVIDPYRPPFQSVKHVNYEWNFNSAKEGLCEPEYSDDELRRFAQEKKVLISLMFWSGMIREVANLYNLMDLFAMTKLRCGLVLTAQSFEYMMHSPLELLGVPLQQGGVFPLVEPVLGSCGIGVGIESYFTGDRLQENLKDAYSRLKRKLKDNNLIPRGWWTTMDVDLQKQSWGKRAKFARFLSYPPYLQIRFHKKDEKYEENSDIAPSAKKASLRKKSLEKLKMSLTRMGLLKYFSPFRPYEFYRPGPFKTNIVNAPKCIGLKYMFSKSGFNSNPKACYIDKDFIALNYTAGQWDGWTPFETVNDVSDLKQAERSLLKKREPGWIVSTIDSCLWTFGGEVWKSGNKLLEIAKFCARGGNSGRLINVKPSTIARYARILREKEL